MNYKTAAIIGSQWGDEGKGKIIDYLASEADVVVRAQGGSNAGHTVVIDGKKYALHLIPSGVLNKRAVNIIASGVAFDPEGFFEEIETLQGDGVDTDRIFVSDRAHLVFPWHKELDKLSEEAAGAGGIGTTRKGIGPCYMDKAERSGLRVCDMLDAAAFYDKVIRQARAKNEIIEKIYGGAPLDAAEIAERYAGYASKLRSRVADTAVMIYDAATEGKTVLFEGAQGVMLDIDFGTYPYVTASHPGTGGFVVGAGVSPHMIGEVVGIVKAYTTRVGSGPMVTELLDETGDRIRKAGNEYGTTTGRPRRCGWFDGVVTRHSVRANGTTGLALMLLDVLDDFDEVKICHAYEADGRTIEHFPASIELLERCKPLYKTLPGWKTSLTGCRSYDALPAEAKAYIAEVEALSGAPVKIVSVGPGREQTIIREKVL